MRLCVENTTIVLEVPDASLVEAAAQEQAAVVNDAVLSPLEELGCAVLRAYEAERAGVVLAMALYRRTVWHLASAPSTPACAQLGAQEHVTLSASRINCPECLAILEGQHVAWTGNREQMGRLRYQGSDAKLSED